MRNIYYLLAGTYFESSSYHTQQFTDFYTKFCSSIKRELKKIKATDIQLSKGHFYISGFFKVGEQCFYISLSDVRGNDTNLLIRTAKHYKDYTGGGNYYVSIDTGMAKKIAQIFRLEFTKPTKPVNKSLDVDKLTNLLNKNGSIEVSVPTQKKAYHLAWDLSKNVGESFKTIGGMRYGRRTHTISEENELVSFVYTCESKRFVMTLSGHEERVLLNSLEKYTSGSKVRNPYSGEECELNAEQLALYDFIKGAEMTRHPNFRVGLGIFRVKYPKEYMVLLD